MLAMIVFSTIPTVSMSWSRNVWFTSLKGRKDASSITARTCSSKSTGRTMTLTGVLSPSPDVMRM